MISICIPIYNRPCLELVSQILQQKEIFYSDIEIICIDDGSNQQTKKDNQQLHQLVTYIELPYNVGRSKIRNKFKEYVKNNWLLFLDCDAIITNSHFLLNYIQTIKSFKTLVICGGTHFLPFNNASNLCYKYYKSATKKLLAKHRNVNSYAAFMTNNVVIHKSVFDKIQFNKNLTKYGHEDTLFGFELLLNKISVLHIDNQAVCLCDDSNTEFIAKTNEAIVNLIQIEKYVNLNKEFINNVSLLNIYYKTKSFYGLFVFKALGTLFLNPLKRLLLKGFFNTQIFQLYKLLLLVKIKHKSKNK